ncbi:MAG TPA: PD-(D/E)XK nuclease family protein, partial [Pyrinomonadaceae bacterium]|nr:PD-(D/E)XK nuclease family protein [Pyrinomonadaceae bacterium]
MHNVWNEIWLSPLLGNSRTLLIERCADYVATDENSSFIYLAASHPLLEVVTQKILDKSKRSGVWGELPVYLFRGLTQRILSSAVDDVGHGIPPRIPIDRDELPLKRSLVSQILLRLLAQGKLQAMAPLATREGCVNTVTTLLGELQRAAKTPAELAEIVLKRRIDLELKTPARKEPGTFTQIDFDNEISLIYSTYTDLLNNNQFTEEDHDQLRALSALRGELDGQHVQVPWLSNVKLLIIDGFFDFTPIQGELLRQIIPHIPQTIVNLNHDDRNAEIFVPFQETIGQLQSIANFEIKQASDYLPTSGVLSSLRVNLFNSSLSETPASDKLREIRYLECGDRETEIRDIAHEVKRLVLTENYDLADIALVVRERASYANTIARVLRQESIPCNLELRIEGGDVPANRAALKLIALLEGVASEGDPTDTRIADLADLIKSEYFRLEDAELATLNERFDAEYLDLLRSETHSLTTEAVERLKNRFRIGMWDADALENAFAYVGSDLHVNAWLARAQKLITNLPKAEATKELLNIDIGAHDRDRDVADNVENSETAKIDEKGKLDMRGVEKKRRPSRDIHPAALAWTSLVIQRFAELMQAIPRKGRPAELRVELTQLLSRLGFREQIAEPTRQSNDERELPQVMLNLNALESIRRALVAAVKSIEITSAEAGESIRLSIFLQEVRRCLHSQSQLLGAADRSGLRILEATDVRGLRFRAIFTAGLIEGGFPLRFARDWIYPHEERERLKEYGLTLEDISPATLLKEEHYFYQVACRATERLFLSRPLLLEDDSETVRSYYVDELRRAVAPFEVPTEIVRRDYEGRELEDISNITEMSIALVRQQERHRHHVIKDKLVPLPRVTRLLTLARNDGYISGAALHRIRIERERCGFKFGPYDGEITDPHLLELLKEKFGSEFVHSASGLSVYGNCPFRFFAQRVLRLEPRGEAALDLQAIDAGKLLHDVLRRFFERHRRQPLYKLDRKALRTELAQVADAVFDEHERVVPPLNKQIWKIDREIRKILLDQVLLYELEVQEESSGQQVLPAFFEVAFGGARSSAKDPESKDEPLELTRPTLIGDE